MKCKVSRDIVRVMSKRRRRRSKPTARRRSAPKGSLILKLFALGFLGVGILCIIALLKPAGSFGAVATLLDTNFGSVRFLFPILLLFLGLFILRLPFFLSSPTLAIGFMFIFFSLDAIFKSGTVGNGIASNLINLLGPVFSNIIFFIALFVGTVVFFDTTIDDLLQSFLAIMKNVHRFFPKSLFAKRERAFEPLGNSRSLAIKNGTIKEKDERILPQSKPLPDSAIHKKETKMMTDHLVSNIATTGAWEYPPLNILSDTTGQKADRGDVKRTASTIEKTLQSFSIDARVTEVNLGPAVTQYALELSLGTKVSKITSLSNDLALATEAPTGQIRIEAPIPGRSLVGIEIPNKSLEIVPLRAMLASSVMQKNRSKLTVSLGLDVSGTPMVADLAKMPHALIAGTTGSGKSVALNSFIASLLFRASPNEVKMIMIDPKRVEMIIYNGIPHLLTPVIVEVDKILSSLKWALAEMDRRYKIFAERGVRNIDSYNEASGFQALPYIVILIDELADLMSYAPVEVEDSIARLAQMARATGIHLVVATQRPSVDVITGLIKANIPCRIAFNVSSMTDSRVILDTPGAEKLLGRGDMLYVPPDQAKPTRIQGTFIAEKDIKKIVDFLKEKNPVVNYTEEVTQQPIVLKKGGASVSADGSDSFLDEAIRVICQYDKASASLLQRKLSIGYSRAARILDQLEEMGVVGHAEGSKPRDVLVKNADEFIANLHQN